MDQDTPVSPKSGFDFSTETENTRAMVRTMQSEAKERRDRNRALIDSAFPSQGTLKGSHEGSQSWTPNR